MAECAALFRSTKILVVVGSYRNLFWRIITLRHWNGGVFGGHIWSVTEQGSPLVKRLYLLLMALALAVPLSGCIIAPARPGYCYWHPYRC